MLVALGQYPAVSGDHAIVLADTRDPVGYEIAKSASSHGGHDVTDDLRRVVASGRIPTAIIIVSRHALARALAPVSPRAADVLRQPPPVNTHYVAVVAAGGTTLMHLQGAPAHSSGLA